MIPVVIPAKNEEKCLEDTVTSLRETASFANEELFIVIVDDGSTDNTPQIAKDLDCNVVTLIDRGFSALGMPVLADTHNAGFKYIDEKLAKNSYKYLMVVGADTTFEPDYISTLLKAMEKDSSLVICAGILNGIKTNYDAVRGTGRMIRNDFWTLIGRNAFNKYYSWESYPIVFANANGFKTRTIYDATMYTPREPLAIIDWKNYGVAMKENGSIFLYVFFRATKRLFEKKDIYNFYRILYGYVTSKPNLYDKKLRDFNSKKQFKKLFYFANN
jgi:glycosyltransferase involved in cell wall biosynthesis